MGVMPLNGNNHKIVVLNLKCVVSSVDLAIENFMSRASQIIIHYYPKQHACFQLNTHLQDYATYRYNG